MANDKERELMVGSDAFVSRREAIRYMLAGSAGLFLGSSLCARAQTGAPPARLIGSTKKGKAKAVILIWMWGGPSHLDTFDPKPDAGNDYCGPFKKPIATNVPGIQICELLPLLAQQADKYSILRGMTHGSNAHETAAYMMQTGNPSGDDLVHPSIGAVVALKKGEEAGYSSLLPPYVAVTSALGRFSEAGFLGSRYKAFATGGNPNNDPFAVEGIVSEGVSEQRQKDRRELLHNLDSFGHMMAGNPQFEKLDAAETQAYELILGDTGKVFDLTREDKALRDNYGRNKFGQSCLAARRLVEHGVLFVSINFEGWDTHKENFGSLRRKLPEFDKGLASLLKDLSDRGLLDSTIVVCMGEFGRTPKIQWESPWNGGRGHWGKAFSAVVAGGGFQPGHVVGSTNATGEEVKDRPIYPWDLAGSLYELLGIDPDSSIRHPQGQMVRLIPLANKNIKSGGRLHEIM